MIPPSDDPVDIEADWTLFHTCNYACDYCYFTPEQLRSKRPQVASNEAWQRAFDATGLRWLIHLTGGEPTLLPGFADLCERLTRQHRISLNSNLSHPAILGFAAVVDPGRVWQVNASFHPAERAARRGDAPFIEHVQALREKGFAVMVSVVATPDVLADFEGVRARLVPYGIEPVPKLLRGGWRGEDYPAAYSAGQRAAFTQALAAARARLPGGREGDAPRRVIDPFVDDRYVAALPDFTGRRCGAGRTFVQIDPQGVVRRCPGEPLGGLLDGSFRRAEADLLCAWTHCHYWCLRHVDLAESEQAVAPRRALLSDMRADAREAQRLESELQQVRLRSGQRLDALRRLLG